METNTVKQEEMGEKHKKRMSKKNSKTFRNQTP